MSLSASAEEALLLLKKTKPLGGWSVEKSTSGVRLLRRKIPVNDTYFVDLHHDPATNCVVGIVSNPFGKPQGQVLVDSNGNPVNKLQLLTATYYKPGGSSSSTTQRPRSSATNTSATSTLPSLTDEQNKLLLQYAVYAVVGAVILRLVTTAISVLTLLLLPAIYLYALQSCPSEVSFDAKKELRRVMRGHHLPENHPDKPKGFLGETIARLGAAVGTELATGLGYEVSMMSIGGAAWFTSVKVPTSAMEFYWIGAFDRWTYVYARKLEQD